MTTTAQRIDDGFDTAGARLTTLRLRYPSYIHADIVARGELRIIQENTGSSSAEALIEEVSHDPVKPLEWTTGSEAVQLEVPAFMDLTEPGGELLALSDLADFREDTKLVIRASPVSTTNYFEDLARTQEAAWLEARDLALLMARRLQRAGYEKIARRLLAPFTHTEIIACTPDWTSFLQWTSEPEADPALADLGHSIREQLGSAGSGKA